MRLGLLGGPIGGGAIAMTLMACYGMPPCDDGTMNCYDTLPTTEAGADASDAREGDALGTPDSAHHEAGAADADAGDNNDAGDHDAREN
jgi:hypothetical protein